MRRSFAGNNRIFWPCLFYASNFPSSPDPRRTSIWAQKIVDEAEAPELRMQKMLCEHNVNVKVRSGRL